MARFVCLLGLAAQVYALDFDGPQPVAVGILTPSSDARGQSVNGSAMLVIGWAAGLEPSTQQIADPLVDHICSKNYCTTAVWL
jgi:hypothetical protein